MFACWHFVSIFWRCYVIILQFGWFVCVCLCWHNMWFGKRGAEGKARHLCYSNQQVNKSILRSRFFWCSFFLFWCWAWCIIFFREFFENWSSEPRLKNPKCCQRCHRTVSTTPSMMCWSPGGGKRLMSTMNGIFFGFSAASGMAWSRDWYMLTAEICWHIPGIYLVYVNGWNLLKHRRLCKWVSQTSAGMLLYWWKLTGKVLKHFLLNP